MEANRSKYHLGSHGCQNYNRKKGLKLTLKEGPKTAVKHLFEERYDTWWRFYVMYVCH